MMPSTPRSMSILMSARSLTVHGSTLMPSAWESATSFGVRFRQNIDHTLQPAARLAEIEQLRELRKTFAVGCALFRELLCVRALRIDASDVVTPELRESQRANLWPLRRKPLSLGIADEIRTEIGIVRNDDDV